MYPKIHWGQRSPPLPPSPCKCAPPSFGINFHFCSASKKTNDKCEVKSKSERCQLPLSDLLSFHSFFFFFQSPPWVACSDLSGYWCQKTSSKYKYVLQTSPQLIWAGRTDYYFHFFFFFHSANPSECRLAALPDWLSLSSQLVSRLSVRLRPFVPDRDTNVLRFPSHADKHQTTTRFLFFFFFLSAFVFLKIRFPGCVSLNPDCHPSSWASYRHETKVSESVQKKVENGFDGDNFFYQLHTFQGKGHQAMHLIEDNGSDSGVLSDVSRMKASSDQEHARPIQQQHDNKLRTIIPLFLGPWVSGISPPPK